MSAPPRSLLVTILAWLLVIGGVLLLPISFISALMLMVGSHGTANATLGGAVMVVFGPAAVAVAGFGLWRRWRWAWASVLVGLLAVLLWQAAGWWRGPTPSHSYVSPGGTLVTVTGSGPAYSPLLILASIAALGLLLLPGVRAEFRPPLAVAATAAPAAGPPPEAEAEARARGWRVGHQGRDRMYYDEWRDGRWQRLDIDGEMLMGEAHHAVYLAAPDRWRHYPEWARDRRDEIVARIRSAFTAPAYEYGPEASGVPPSPSRPPPAAVTPSQRSATRIVAMVLVLFALAMAWLVWHGLDSGQTWWPARQKMARHIVTRVADPAMYWTALALYTTVGLGALALLGWGRRILRGEHRR